MSDNTSLTSSASERSEGEDDHHPMDRYLAQRQEADGHGQNGAKRPSAGLRSSPPKASPADEFEAALAVDSSEEEDEEDSQEEEAEEEKEPGGQSSGGEGTSSSGSESDDEASSDEDEATPKPAKRLKLFLAKGVTVLEEGQEATRNTEMSKLLRVPRYFDDDYEEAAMRCYRCGGSGHMARDCTNAARLRACFLCAQLGHDGRDCPQILCWKCHRTGHSSRDCPYPHGKRAPRPWDEEDATPCCLRCGREDCPCAGSSGHTHAAACTNQYKAKDMAQVRCPTCGEKGHLGCAPDSGEVCRPSCYNCGAGGHTAEDCRSDVPAIMRAERAQERGRGGSGRGRFNQREDYSGGGHGRQQQQQERGAAYRKGYHAEGSEADFPRGKARSEERGGRLQQQPRGSWGGSRGGGRGGSSGGEARWQGSGGGDSKRQRR